MKKIVPGTFFAQCAPVVVLGHGIGRLGCTLAGCCFGKELSWLGNARYPAQLIEACFLFFLCVFLKEGKRENIYLYPLSYSLFRFFNEFFRGDIIRGQIAGAVSTSQGVSILLFLLGLGIFYREKRLS